MEINGKYCFYGRRAIAIILVGHGLGLFGACLWSHANLRYLDIGMLLGSVFLLATGFCLWRNKYWAVILTEIILFFCFLAAVVALLAIAGFGSLSNEDGASIEKAHPILRAILYLLISSTGLLSLRRASQSAFYRDNVMKERP